MKISVVIPVYNSEQTLEELHHRLSNVLPHLCADYEIIMVDDGSGDRSFFKMQKIKVGDPRVKLIQFAGNFGQQNALLCGFRYASGDCLVTIDDDLQNPPEEIPRLLAKLMEGYDVVFGIPLEKQHSSFRNLGTALIDLLLNRIADKPRDIKVSSFRILTREIYSKISNVPVSFVYLAPLIFWLTDNASNLTVRHDPRKTGRSNYNPFKLLILVLKLILFYTKLSKYLPVRHDPQYKIKQIML